MIKHPLPRSRQNDCSSVRNVRLRSKAPGSYACNSYTAADRAIIAGMVSTESSVITATVLEAKPVSRPYFAANITVLLAVGALAEIMQEVSSVPVMPHSRKINSRRAGSANSFRKAAR